jgi:hypothetical protein
VSSASRGLEQFFAAVARFFELFSAAVAQV